MIMFNKIIKQCSCLAAFLFIGMMLALVPAGTWAQATGTPEKGVVSDQYNNPIPGVIVTLKGTTQSVTTNGNGEFPFTYKKGDVLTFTHINYLYKEMKVGNIRNLKINKVFSVHLADKFTNDELAITGPYGETTPKDEFLGSASTVYTKDLDKYLAPNIMTALQGRLTGFNVQQYRGFALGNITDNTQGSLMGSIPASFGAGSYGDNTQFLYSSRGQGPVVIVDGVQREMLSLDPEAIESVTLEKDALSSMFLGMQSSRGALIITTKKPSKGELHVSLTGKFGFHSSVKKLHPLDAGTYTYLLNEALQNDGRSPLYSRADFDAYRSGNDPYLHPNVNWEDELLKDNAISQSYNMNVSGGGKVAQYFVSLGYLNEQGLFKTDKSQGYDTNLKLNRYMISSKVHINITDDFEATMTALGRVIEGNQPGGTGSGYSDLLLNIYETPNYAYPIHNPNGTWGGNISFTNNLMSQTENSGYISDNTRDIQASLKLNYDFNKLVKGLSATALGNVISLSKTAIKRTKQTVVYDYREESDGSPVYTMYGENKSQSNDFSDVASYNELYGQFSVDYDRSFGVHGLKGKLMADTHQQIGDYDLPKLPTNIMERVEYDYSKKYFAQFAMTQSYYNRYAPGHRWGNFWAGGLGWDIAKESFMEPASWINRLKLRATFGHTGNGITNSGYFIYRQVYESMGTTYYPYGESQSSDIRATQESSLANPYITWEKANKFNVGLDVSLFNRRLDFTFDYYNDKYYDLLQTRGKSIELLGTSYPNENIGKVRRQGLELSASWQDHVSNFNYYVSGNWSVEYAKLLFMDEQNVPYDYMRQTGNRPGATFGLVADGFLSAEDIANNYPVMRGFTNIRPGDVKYKDLNGDGVIDQYDRTIIGNNKPLGYFGIDLGFEWKGLEFSMFWQGVYNRDLYLSNRTLTEGFQNKNQMYGQAYENIIKRWTPETAETATYPRLTAGGNNYNQGNGWASSLWVRSGNYIRLKNISIGYNLPELFCKNYLGGVRAKIFVNAQNLFTMSACDLIDPEVTFTSSPLQKTIFTGINLKF